MALRVFSSVLGCRSFSGLAFVLLFTREGCAIATVFKLEVGVRRGP